MILSLAILLLSGQVESDCVRVTRAGGCVRANGRSGAGFAFFEAFPISGAGTSGACSAVAPTGAKGEALTTARASGATCNSNPAGGTATTGIPNATLVELGSNVARQEYDAQGVLGLRVESSRQNVLVRFIDYTNGAWADVGTPTATTGQTSPFTGTYASSAVQYEDNDGAAFEGRTQTVTVSAGAAYTMHCYVKAGTLDQARISLDGTAVNITGLSSSTWSIVSVTDASTSGVAVAAQILNGDATGDTGTVIWGGCQVEAGSYFTSIIPTVAAAVTRAVDNGFTAPVTGSSTAGSVAWTVTPIWSTGAGPVSTVIYGARYDATSLFYLNTFINGWRVNDGTTDCTNPGAVLTAGASTRTWASWGVAGMLVNDGVDTTTCAFDGSWGTPPLTTLLASTTAGSALDGIITRYCFDPDPLRCR